MSIAKINYKSKKGRINMKLDKENTKQILKIVIIAIIVLVALLNIEPVWNAIKVVLSILSPFIWGLAIAFILNIFMTFYENKLFKLGKNSKRKNDRLEKRRKTHLRGDFQYFYQLLRL